MHMQIIAVGVTNRRDKRSVIYSFRGPFWTALTHICVFFRFLTPLLQLALANSGSGDFRTDSNDRTDYFTLCACARGNN